MAGGFGEDADMPPDFLIILADAVVEDGAAAGSWANQTGQHAHGRRLARAIWPQKAKNLPLGHVQRQAIHSYELVKLLCQIFGMNHEGQFQVTGIRLY